MATMMRARKSIKVFPADGGFRVLWFVTIEHAEQKEQLGIWRPEYDSVTGCFLGMRIVGGVERKVDADLRSTPMPAALTRAEMETVAGCRGRSHTIGRREQQRLEEIARGCSPEDRIERTLAKFRVYDKVGAAKGDILKAWPK
jgi:hypothetical protein